MTEKQASSEIAQSRELQQAIRIANLFLERPYFDPEGDECVLARQFLRQQEKLAAAERDTRERCAQIAEHFLDELTAEEFPPHGLHKASMRWDSGHSEQFVKWVAERIRGKE